MYSWVFVKENMSRGGSYGGGKSSLGYLFGSDEQPNETRAPPPVVKAPWGDDNSTNTPQDNPSNKLNVSNNYHRAQGQNSGNFLTVSED